MPANDIDTLSPHGIRVWFSEDKKGMQKAHLHQDLEFNYLLHGSMQYLIGGTFVTVPERRLCIIWGAMPHQLFVNSLERRTFLATLPLAQAIFSDLPRQFIVYLLGHGIAVDPCPNEGDLPMLQQWQRDLARNDTARQRLVLGEIASRLHRLALNVLESGSTLEHSSGAMADAASNDGLLLTQTMAQIISELFQEPLAISEIARRVNLHPNYAMTLFRKQTGMTLNVYLTRQRIAHAQRLLATTTLSILEIAEESGFHSVSRFYEAFKAESSCTPHQFRRRMVPSYSTTGLTVSKLSRF